MNIQISQIEQKKISNPKTKMKFQSIFLATVVSTAPFVQANVFIDDFGDEFTLRSNPRIVTSAQAAVSLMHLGLPKEYLAATWGSPYNRFSIAHEGKASQFGSSDATEEDVNILREIATFTPGCFDDYSKCYTPDFLHPLIDLNLVESFKKSTSSAEKPNIILDFSNHYYGYDAIQNMTHVLEIPAAHINIPFGDSKCFPQPNTMNYVGTVGEGCSKRSMLDTTKRLYDFAEFLGVDAQHERQDLCDAAAEFQQAAKTMQEKGIRVMFAGMGDFYGTGWQVVTSNPLHFGSIRTYEELGLPILWPGSCPAEKHDSCYPAGPLPAAYEFLDQSLYFPKCAEEGDTTYSGNCVKEPLYPVDVWILEGMSYEAWRTTPEMQKLRFNDLAYQRDQVLPLLADEGVFSHRAIARQLREMTAKMLRFERLHNKSDCTQVNVVSSSHIEFDDSPPLNGGEYACYNERFHNQEYLRCSINDDNKEKKDDTLSTGAIIGIAVAGVVGILVLFTVHHRLSGSNKLSKYDNDDILPEQAVAEPGNVRIS